MNISNRFASTFKTISPRCLNESECKHMFSNDISSLFGMRSTYQNSYLAIKHLLIGNPRKALCEIKLFKNCSEENINSDSLYSSILHSFGFSDKINNIVNSIISPYPSIIGMHIRTGQVDALRVRLKNNIGFAKENGSNFYLKCINDNAISGKIIYLASDSMNVKRNSQLFHEHTVLSSELIPEHSGTKSNSALLSSLVDIVALSKCKVVIGTWKSTFSILASALGSVPLYVIKGSSCYQVGKYVIK